MRTTYLISIFLFLVSCSQPKQKVAKTFRVNIHNGISSLDPAFARNQSNIWGAYALFDGLVRFDDELNILPAIAKSYSISEDGLSYTFTLRDNVYFTDEECFKYNPRRVISHDFVYSLERLMDPNTASPGAWLFRDRLDSNGFQALNDTTFQIGLKKPFKPLLGLLAMQYCSVVPWEAVKMYGEDFRSHPVGCGPFRMVKWVENEYLVLERNPLYYLSTIEDPIPKVDRLEFSFIDNKATEFFYFMDGQLDFISDLDGSLKDRVLNEQGNLAEAYQKKIDLIRSPYLNTEYFGILEARFIENQEDEALKLRLIRLAIHHGINKKKMLRFLRNGKGIPANYGMIPIGMPGMDLKRNYGIEYNPTKSIALLAEAGFPKGEGIEKIVLYIPPTYQDIGAFLQSELLEIGIKLETRVMQPAALRGKMQEQSAGMFRASWIADYADPENYMSLFYSKNGVPPNYTGHQNAVFDSLYESAWNLENEEERYSLYQTMDSLVISSGLVIPLYYDEVYRFKQKNVVGLGSNSLNLLDLRYVDFR